MGLFKYMGVVAATSFLENLTIRYNQVKAYNDPFEMSPVFITDQPNKKGQGLEVKYAGFTSGLESLSYDHIPKIGRASCRERVFRAV